MAELSLRLTARQWATIDATLRSSAQVYEELRDETSLQLQNATHARAAIRAGR